jgi:hypothetical protein
MSYCRFSSDNWNCDVYVYENCSGGWTTHVADRRLWVRPIPAMDHLKITTKVNVFILWIRIKLWRIRYTLNVLSLKLIPLRRSNLPYAGETFNDPTPQQCAARLVSLLKLGYKVPDFAIQALLNEALNSLLEEIDLILSKGVKRDV